jgi:phosphatidylinositol dimannoside acyltransferase
VWLLRTLRIVAILTPIVPATIGYGLCRILGILFFALNFRARRNVLANLRVVDPRPSWFARQVTAARVCITVVTNYYDLLRLRSVDRNAVLDHVEVEGLEHVHSALERGCGVIIVSGHMGNFSVMAKLPAVLGMRAALIAERVEPAEVYHYMARLRSAMGIEVIPPGPRALRRTLELLNGNGVLLLAADRDVTLRGSEVELFGRTTTLPTGPIALAMKTGAALIPAYTLRETSFHSRVVIEPPIELCNTGCREADLQHNHQLLAANLERMIAEDPGQWAVLQRVWPPTTRYGRSEGMGSADELLPEDIRE